MARSFAVVSNQLLKNSNAVRSSTPLSMGGWFYIASATNATAISMSDEAGDLNYFALSFVTGTALRAQARASGNYAEVDTTSTPGTSTWYHGLAVYTSQSSRAVYLDGGNKGTNSTDISGDPVGMDNTIIGALERTTAINYWDGYLAEFAIWNVALTDADAVILAAGYSPLLVRPQSLVAYWPLAGRQSPEMDLIGGYNMTLNNGPTVADHPPVFHDANTGLMLPDVNDYPVSLLRLVPQQAVPPSSSYASFTLRNRHPVIVFSSGSQEDIVFDFVVPKTYSGNGLALVLHSSLASATSGFVRAGVALERIGDGQQDVDSDGFADSNYQSFPVPALSGWVQRSRVRFSDGTDMDSISAGEKCRLRVRRYSDDTASGDWQLHMVDIRGK